MSKDIRIRKGLDIRLQGVAEKLNVEAPYAEIYAIKPPDFQGLTPKLAIKAGDVVKAGDVLFWDKKNPDFKVTSPISGEIAEIVRGAKRKILEVKILADKDVTYKTFETANPSSLDKQQVLSNMLESGVFSFVKQRPFDIVADYNITPKSIFVSGFDSNPLAPEFTHVVKGQEADFQTGLDALSKLTDGSVFLTNKTGETAEALTNASNVEVNSISGPHPAGNVGTQIHFVSPINKGEVVWTVDAQAVIIIGRLFNQGKYDATKLITVAGPVIKDPKYVSVKIGASIKHLVENNVTRDDVRYISGNALTGDRIEKDGTLGVHHNQLTVLEEGDKPKFILTKGWLGLGFDKFSNSRLYPTWLTGKKQFALDTNINGEERGFVVTGELERVFPFDIYPVHLIKSVMYGDIEEMENLGIYEIAPEDFALCEFVCTSKIDIQKIIREGLDLVKVETT